MPSRRRQSPEEPLKGLSEYGRALYTRMAAFPLSSSRFRLLLIDALAPASTRDVLHFRSLCVSSLASMSHSFNFLP